MQPTPKMDEIHKRRVPCLVAYLAPFRIVERDEEPTWSPSIGDVNSRGWDYVALHEMTGGIDVGLEAPAHLVIARDGAMALPLLERFRDDQAAVSFFNHCLVALLLGGVYCQAIDADGLEIGSIIDWKYLRSGGTGMSASNRFHKHVRHRQASALEAIGLYKPTTTTVEKLSDAMRIGLSALSKIEAVRGEYLLRGTTAIARRDWGAALANLWIVVEQLLSTLWETKVVAPTAKIDGSKARRSQLDDTRTWTASARIEMLWQKGVLDQELFRSLGEARKARNALSHIGEPPAEAAAQAAYQAVTGLLRAALPEHHLPVYDLDLSNHQVTDPMSPPDRLGGEPQFWMAIPKLPGEEELERLEARLRSGMELE